MLEIIKNVSEIMNGFYLFDGKIGVTDGKIAVVFPADVPEVVSSLPRRIDGIKKVTDKYKQYHDPKPVILPVIKHVSPCIVCRGDYDAEIICAECDGEGVTPCCECGQNTTCRQCEGSGIRKEANKPCLHCANTGFEAEIYPIKVAEGRYISVKYAAFIQKHLPDAIFYVAENDEPATYFESPATGAYGVVMCMAGILKSTKIYSDLEEA